MNSLTHTTNATRVPLVLLNAPTAQAAKVFAAHASKLKSAFIFETRDGYLVTDCLVNGPRLSEHYFNGLLMRDTRERCLADITLKEKQGEEIRKIQATGFVTLEQACYVANGIAQDISAREGKAFYPCGIVLSNGDFSMIPEPEFFAEETRIISITSR